MAKLIDLILSDITLFGDGPPQLVQGKRNRPTRTAAEADHERDRVLRFIRKHVAAYPGLTPISAQLTACTTDNPCASGACPRCQRAVQRWFSRAGGALVGELQAEGASFKCMSIIPTRTATPAQQPSGGTGNVKNALRRLHKGFSAAGLGFVVGGLDFSFNEVEGSAAGSLSIHFWGLGLDSEVSIGRSKLKASFPAIEPGTPRPVKTPAFNGSSKAIAYAYKDDFQRRVSVVSARQSTGSSSRNTRDRSMRVHQKARLWVKLDRLGLLGRLILIGVDLAPTCDGVRLTRSTAAGPDCRADQSAGASITAIAVDPADSATCATTATTALTGKKRSSGSP